MTTQVPSSSLDQMLTEVIDSALVEVHTCLPAIINSFNAATQTASVNVAIKRIIKNQDGTETSRMVSQLHDIPVTFPQVQGFAITMPLKKDDNCLLLIAERNTENWYLQGGVRDPRTRDRFDYSDAFVLPIANTSQNQLADYSSDALEIRSRDGTNKIVLTAGGDVTIENSGQVTVNTTEITLNSNTTINGSLTVTDSATLGSATIGGLDFGTHKHGGVTQGGDPTLGPQA